MTWVFLYSFCREEPKPVRGDVTCPRLQWSLLLFYQSHLTSHSGLSRPYRSHTRKASKTIFAWIYEQYVWSLLSKWKRRTTHPQRSLPVSFWNKAWGGSLKKIGLTPKNRWQPKDLLSARNAWGTDQNAIKLYVCAYTYTDGDLYHKIRVKTCLSRFILLKYKLRYIKFLSLFEQKSILIGWGHNGRWGRVPLDRR